MEPPLSWWDPAIGELGQDRVSSPSHDVMLLQGGRMGGGRGGGFGGGGWGPDFSGGCLSPTLHLLNRLHAEDANWRLRSSGRTACTPRHCQWLLRIDGRKRMIVTNRFFAKVK